MVNMVDKNLFSWWVWVGVGAYDLFFGYMWVSVTFFWLGVDAYG